jgi:hypothetical protein
MFILKRKRASISLRAAQQMPGTAAEAVAREATLGSEMS